MEIVLGTAPGHADRANRPLEPKAGGGKE
jgi:hypothetical protein